MALFFPSLPSAAGGVSPMTGAVAGAAATAWNVPSNRHAESSARIMFFKVGPSPDAGESSRGSRACVCDTSAMPELPEVETTRAGLAPHLEGRKVTGVVLRRPNLRWPIPPEVSDLLPGQRIEAVRRRAKYLLLDTAAGSALLHLGMSGSLRVLPANTPVEAHDHVDVALDSRRVLRFNDPRRFGCLLWQPPGETHALLAGLGPEPLSQDFDGDYLFFRSRGRSAPVKTFLMDQRIVVGVGNIYAAEALFAAGISPHRAAGRVSRERYAKLATAVKDVLAAAII